MAEKPRLVHSPGAVASLRAITYRLSSTSTDQLPCTATHTAALLWGCRDLLATPQDQLKADRDASAIVHRFKTTLSSLLQDRSVRGRWAGIVLIKATIEAGGDEVLAKSNGWIKGLVSVLKKADPPSSRAMAVITLTRVFVLSWNHSHLVREITTPNLPAFVESCLNNISNKRCSPTELEVILDAFATLLPRHPTIFRTIEDRLRSVLALVLSSTEMPLSPTAYYTSRHCTLASRVLSLLHYCAPKQSSREKWSQSISATLTAAHSTSDLLFRSVVERWQPSSPLQYTSKDSLVSPDVELAGTDAAGLTSWSGIYAGSARLSRLLEHIQSHLDQDTTAIVAVPLGAIIDLMARLFSITVDFGNDNASVRPNPGIGKEERDAMFSVLPGIHVAALSLLRSCILGFGTSVVGSCGHIIELITAVFKAESANPDLRAATYEALSLLVKLVGQSMEKQDFAQIDFILKTSCSDLLSAHAILDQTQGRGTKLHWLNVAAMKLLPISISTTSQHVMPAKLRANIERTAVLTRHKKTLFACVMNPSFKNGQPRASLLPLLTQMYPDSAEVEIFLRPRMPPVSKAGDTLEQLEDSQQSEHDVTFWNTRHESDEPTVREPLSLDASSDPNPNGPTPMSMSLESDPQLDNPTARNNETVVAINGQPQGKRQAPDVPQSTILAKKRRGSVDAEPPPTRANEALHSVRTSLNSGVVPSLDQSARREWNETSQLQTQTSLPHPESDNDESDFEMPPLTMEPDTDPEDD